MQTKADTTTTSGDDAARASSVSLPYLGLEHGPHPKADHHNCVCPRCYRDSLARWLCAAQSSRQGDSDGIRGGVDGRDSGPWFAIVGVGGRHDGILCGGVAALAPRLDLVLVAPSTFNRAPKRAARCSLEGAPLSCRTAYGRAVRRHGRQGIRLRWKHPALLAHSQPLPGPCVARLLRAVLAAARSYRTR